MITGVVPRSIARVARDRCRGVDDKDVVSTKG